MITGYLWVDVMIILTVILFIDIFWGIKRDDEN